MFSLGNFDFVGVDVSILLTLAIELVLFSAKARSATLFKARMMTVCAGQNGGPYFLPGKVEVPDLNEILNFIEPLVVLGSRHLQQGLGRQATAIRSSGLRVFRELGFELVQRAVSVGVGPHHQGGVYLDLLKLVSIHGVTILGKLLRQARNAVDELLALAIALGRWWRGGILPAIGLLMSRLVLVRDRRRLHCRCSPAALQLEVDRWPVAVSW